MTDNYGNKLNIGDTVVYLSRGAFKRISDTADTPENEYKPSLQMGRVVAINKKVKVRTLDKSRRRDRYSGGDITTLMSSHLLMKVFQDDPNFTQIEIDCYWEGSEKRFTANAAIGKYTGEPGDEDMFHWFDKHEDVIGYHGEFTVISYSTKKD